MTNTTFENRLHYDQMKISNTLSQFVDSIVEVKGKTHFAFERVLPKAKIELIFNLSKGFYYQEEYSREIKICKDLMLSGLKKSYYDLYTAHDMHLLIVSIKPEAFEFLFGIKPHDVVAGKVNATDLVPKKINFKSKIYSKCLVKERFEIIEEWITKKIKGREYKENMLVKWIQLQLNADVNVKIQHLVEKSGYSHKHLYTSFKKHIGLSIKEYQELLRFYQFVNELHANPCIIDAVYTLEYYDQSHLIKVFKEKTGVTPTVFKDKYNTVRQSLQFAQ